MGAVKVSTDTVSHLLGAEQPCGLDKGALARRPLGRDGSEPGALDRQGAGQDAHALPLLLAPSIVRTDPGPHPLTDRPRGVIPAQRPHAHAFRRHPCAAPAQDLLGDGAHRTALDKAQPDALGPAALGPAALGPAALGPAAL